MDDIIYFCEESLFTTRKKAGAPDLMHTFKDADFNKIMNQKMFDKTTLFSVDCLSATLTHIDAYEF